MGRQLINVGLTRFNDFGYPLEQIAKSPVKDNLVAACQSSEDLPVDISSRHHKNLGRIEPLLQQLVPSYLALQDELNLNEVLFGYWLSKELPLGANLPVLATSVSILTDAWSKSRSKIKGEYLPKEKFDTLVKDEFAALKEKLKNVEYGDRIMNRLQAANRLGDTEKLWLLCQEIRLPVGKIERDAVRARNYMAHGSSKIFNEAAYVEMVEATLAYQTLFNRILLKILGYEGKYTDRSTPGYLERSINQPLKGESPT